MHRFNAKALVVSGRVRRGPSSQVRAPGLSERRSARPPHQRLRPTKPISLAPRPSEHTSIILQLLKFFSASVNDEAPRTRVAINLAGISHRRRRRHRRERRVLVERRRRRRRTLGDVAVVLCSNLVAADKTATRLRAELNFRHRRNAAIVALSGVNTSATPSNMPFYSVASLQQKTRTFLDETSLLPRMPHLFCL